MKSLRENGEWGRGGPSSDTRIPEELLRRWVGAGSREWGGCTGPESGGKAPERGVSHQAEGKRV